MSGSATTRIGTWNLEWAVPSSRRGGIIRDILDRADLDILCLTEARSGNFPSGLEILESCPDYGYPIKEGRRKVLIGSKASWTDVDQIGDVGLPSGRFIAGTTETSIGAVRVIGICIPWRDAHVGSGRRDRRVWEDHSTFIDHLGAVFESIGDVPTIVIGDFNQALPRNRQPFEVSRRLENTMSGFEVITRGLVHEGSPTIDHVAVRGLRGSIEGILPRSTSVARLSDHFGVTAELNQ